MKLVTALLLFVGALAVVNGSLLRSSEKGSSIVDLAVATPDLSTLVTALKAGGLVDTLSGTGPFTVFAPTNEAFAALPKDTLTYLLDPHNVDKLKQVLTYHVVAGAAVKAADLKNGEKVKTVEGQSVTATIDGKTVQINSAHVTTADVVATNGVVHIIDAVLIPSDLKLPSSGSVVDIAAKTSDFSTLVTALKDADLVTTLSGEGPFTVFAPTNEAFAHIPSHVLKYLLADKKKLAAVLEYHVLPARVYADEIKQNELAKTVEGAELLLNLYKDKVFINRYAEVTAADIEGTNGNIHVINRVLFPLHLQHLLTMPEEKIVSFATTY